MAARSRHNLSLREAELSSEFLVEWRNLFDYKIASFPNLERQSRGQWRLIPKTMSVDVSTLAQRGQMVCPAANILIYRLRSFFAVVLKLPVEEGGIAWQQQPSETLALCAHPRALECYLQWITNQSGGVRHNGQKVFARAIASLVRPETGFLWQLPNMFQKRLPAELSVASEDEWQAMCERSHKFLRAYITSSCDTNRHPEEPIADLLGLEDPLRPILDAIDRIQKDAATAPNGGITQARHKRNALLLALLLSNPLRARSLAALTWLPNGNGTLRGNSTSGWRIVLQPTHLKNGGSKGSRAYNVKVADWVKPLLDEYIDEYRDTLLGGKNSSYLLIGDSIGGLWKGISKTILRLTRRYIPGSPGFGPHAVRHLVATTWLRKNPGDFLTVAELLNDSLKTVLENYAHLRRDDSFARYEAQIAQSRGIWA
jgi:integrase